MAIQVFDPVFDQPHTEYEPQEVYHLNGWAGGLDITPQTIGRLAYDDVAGLSVFKLGEGAGERPILLLFLHGRPRPLYVEPGNIKYDDFPNVAQEPTGMGKLRALVKLFTEASVQVTVDRATAAFVNGGPAKPLDRGMLVMATAFSQYLAEAAGVATPPPSVAKALQGSGAQPITRGVQRRVAAESASLVSQRAVPAGVAMAAGKKKSGTNVTMIVALVALAALILVPLGLRFVGGGNDAVGGGAATYDFSGVGYEALQFQEADVFKVLEAFNDKGIRSGRNQTTLTLTEKGEVSGVEVTLRREEYAVNYEATPDHLVLTIERVKVRTLNPEVRKELRSSGTRTAGVAELVDSDAPSYKITGEVREYGRLGNLKVYEDNRATGDILWNPD